MRPIGEYATVVFDCDGVLLDSNRIKTEAFRVVAELRYGRQPAEKLVAYHVAHGGISRWVKFKYLLESVLAVPHTEADVQALCDAYGAQVFERLLACPVAPRLLELRRSFPRQTWMVASGGAQSELREVFRQRQLDSIFDGGIHGSPATKDDILRAAEHEGRLPRPALFLGDSRADHEAARAAGLDFVFVSSWSEFAGWRDYCSANNIPVIDAIGALTAD